MALHPNATTTTDRWTCHTYPAAMWPDMPRRISILFEDEAAEEGNIQSLSLNVTEARELIDALLRAIKVG